MAYTDQPSKDGHDRPASASDGAPLPSRGWFKIENTFVELGHLAWFKAICPLKVYLALRYARRSSTDFAAPSIDEIARATGIHKRNVSRAIRELQAAGFIRLEAARIGWRGCRQWSFPDPPAKSVSPEPSKTVSLEIPTKTSRLPVGAKSVSAEPKVGCPGERPLYGRIKQDVPILFPPPVGGVSSEKTFKPKSKTAATETPAIRHFTDFWLSQKRRENPRFSFTRENGIHLAAVWKSVGEDLELAKATVLAYMADGDRFYEGHPAKKLRMDVEKFMTRAANGDRNGHRSFQTQVQKREHKTTFPEAKAKRA